MTAIATPLKDEPATATPVLCACTIKQYGEYLGVWPIIMQKLCSMSSVLSDVTFRHIAPTADSFCSG
jgi:hypothetical protein